MASRSQPVSDACGTTSGAEPSASVWTAELKAAVRGLIEAGQTLAEIARRTGHSRDVIGSGVRRYGLRPGKAPPPKRERQEPGECNRWTEARLTERWADRRRMALEALSSADAERSEVTATGADTRPG